MMRLSYASSFIFLILISTCIPVFTITILIINLLLLFILKAVNSSNRPHIETRFSLMSKAQAFSELQSLLDIEPPPEILSNSNSREIDIFLYVAKSQYRLNQKHQSKPMAFLFACHHALIDLYYYLNFREQPNTEQPNIWIPIIGWGFALTCNTIIIYYLYRHFADTTASAFLIHWLPFCGISLLIPLQIGVFLINQCSQTPAFPKKRTIIYMPIGLLFLLFLWLISMPPVF